MRKSYLLLAAAAIVPATNASAQTAKPMSLQQKFDAAKDAVSAGDCDTALRLFGELENQPAIQKSALASAAVSVRKGQCLIDTGQYDAGRALIERGLPTLSAKPDFRVDVTQSYVALTKADRHDLDIEAERRDAFAARQAEGETLSFETLVASAKAAMFEDNDDAESYSARALAMAQAANNPSKELISSLQTLHARALLNHGKAGEAYDELRDALKAQGGLSLTVNVTNIVTRSDLAMAALLAGKEDDARKYMAYTGAGLLKGGPAQTDAVMQAPPCGDEYGLRPQDNAVVQFGIDDDGATRFIETVYSSRSSRAAEAFEKAVSGWVWKPEDAAKIPIVLRSAIRVELRCTNKLDRPRVVKFFETAMDDWLNSKGVQTLDDQLSSAPLPMLQKALAEREQKKNPLAPVPVLIALSTNRLVKPDLREEYAEKAQSLVQSNGGTLMPRLLFDVASSAIERNQSTREYRKRLRALLQKPEVAGNADASAALKILIAEPHYKSDTPDDGEALLQEVANDPRLSGNDPLKVNALIRLAGIQADEGRMDAARASYKKTGLTAQQCALIDTPPSVRRENVARSDYPMAARRWGFEGFVETEFDISADGKTAGQRVLIAYPPFVFDDAATGIIRNVEFQTSYRPEGNPGCSSMTQRIRFMLDR